MSAQAKGGMPIYPMPDSQYDAAIQALQVMVKHGLRTPSDAKALGEKLSEVARGITLRDELASRAPITLDAAASCSADSIGEQIRAALTGGDLLRRHARLCYLWADEMLKASLEGQS